MSRLVIGRKVGQRVRIGDAVLEVVSYGPQGVRLCIEAPREVPIIREEVEARLQLTHAERALAEAR